MCSRRSRARESPPFLVGFAAETEHVERNALAKLTGKNLDMIAANKVGDGLAFDKDDNALTVYWRGRQARARRSPASGAGATAGRAHRRALSRARQVTHVTANIEDSAAHAR